MSLYQVEMWFFLPVVLLLYWLGSNRRAWQNSVLVASGYFFYWTWDPKLVWVLALATLVDYGLGRWMDGARTPEGHRKAALVLSLVFNLGQLAYFKYMGFFARSFNDLMELFGLSASAPILKVALPLGLSYFTFGKLAYILEVYHRRSPAHRSLLDFAAWVSFFPQLTAGPIVRPKQMLPQLEVGRRPRASMFAAGAGTFLLGFVLKAYVADWVGPNLVSPVMDHPEGYGAGMRWLAVLAYAVQMFGDFAGYSAMAIGLGRLFALELPENFNFPFISKSMMEFWRRWHITLNTWLFDYVYGPMTMSRGWWRGHLDLGFLVVFGLCGLWHGAAWGFVAWGLLHAAALVVERRWGQFYKTLCRRDRVWVTRRRSWWYATLAWGLTQLWFVITLVPFRLHEPSALGGYLWGMLTATGDKVPPGLEGLRQWQHLAVIGLFMLLYHGLTRPTGQKLQEGFLASPVWVRGVLYGLVLIYLFIFSPLSEGTFVYADF